MQLSNIPAKIQIPFANSGTKNTIPVASQISVTAGAASYTDGFPPLTMTPVVSGGVPPYGADFNGILNAITKVLQWQCGGGMFEYDSAWATANNGYPQGAILLKATGSGYWVNATDNNAVNPDTTGTGWADLGTVISAVVTQTSGDNSTKPASTAFVQTAVATLSTAVTSALATQLGISQTWQQFTVGSTRVLGTTYTNTGVRPIAIAFDCNGNTSGNASLTIGGLVVGSSGGDTTNGATHSQIFGIVPPGGTYSVTSSRATNNWFELR